MARTTIRSEDITAGQVKAADLASDAVPAFDDSGLQTDIAILGFKVAANGSLAKYDLVDQTIDAFEDATGIDASASTGESRNAANYYSSISSSSDAAAWVFGASASGASYGTTIDSGGLRPANAFDSTLSQNQANSYYDDTSTKWIGKDAGSSVTQTCSNWSASGANDYGFNNPWANGNATVKLEYSSNGADWTQATSAVSSGAPGTVGSSFTETAGYRYWRINMTTIGDLRVADFSLYGVKSTQTVSASMSLVSNSTTAEATPTKGDLVLTYTNGAGTATVNTDIKGWVSRDNGTTYTQFTLTDDGDTGGHTILTAHDLDISAQPSGTSMRYKITTHNQSAAKETRIQAVSLGWS
jgi:hypothetical protein